MEKMSDSRQLKIRKTNLESVVKEIHENVPYESFDFQAMTKVLEYLSTNYSQKRISPYNGEVRYVESIRRGDGIGAIFYDVGHSLVKEEMQRVLEQRWQDKKEVKLILDGVLGPIYYNPGKTNERQRKGALKEYSEKYGKERFRKRFDELEILFKELYSLGESAEVHNRQRIRSNGLLQADYATFFSQSSFTLMFLKSKDYFKELYEGEH